MKSTTGSLYIFGLAILLFSFYINNTVSAQAQKSISSEEVREHFKDFYKADPRLVSGDFYQTPQMSESTGDPFYFGSDWKKGTATIHGVKFENLLLRYDIDSHQVILNTVNHTDSYLQIVLKKAEMTEFSMAEELFVAYPKEDPIDGKLFANAMVSGPVDFLIMKSKNLKVTAGGISDYIYQTNTKRTLQYNNRLITYKGVYTLQKLLPQYKPQIKEFIKARKLRFKRKSLEDHASIIAFCNQLIQSGE